MSMTQETATLIDTLATAASKIGSTPASAKLNSLIVELLPPSETAALQSQINELKASSDIKQANLDLARSQFTELSELLDTARSEASTEQQKSDALQGMASILDTALAPV